MDNPQPESFRRDVRIIGLIGTAHAFSHFFQLALPPLFPLLRADFDVSWTVLGFLVGVFYAPPFVDMHNRMKEALALLGRIPAAYVRPPLTPISDAERQRIRLALRAAGLLS